MRKRGRTLAILDEHLFGGKGRRALNTVFLIQLVLLLLENLVVYILCAGNVLSDLIGMDGTAAQIIWSGQTYKAPDVSHAFFECGLL